MFSALFLIFSHSDYFQYVETYILNKSRNVLHKYQTTKLLSGRNQCKSQDIRFTITALTTDKPSHWEFYRRWTFLVHTWQRFTNGKSFINISPFSINVLEIDKLWLFTVLVCDCGCGNLRLFLYNDSVVNSDSNIHDKEFCRYRPKLYILDQIFVHLYRNKEMYSHNPELV